MLENIFAQRIRRTRKQRKGGVATRDTVTWTSDGQTFREWRWREPFIPASRRVFEEHWILRTATQAGAKPFRDRPSTFHTSDNEPTGDARSHFGRGRDGKHQLGAARPTTHCGNVKRQQRAAWSQLAVGKATTSKHAEHARNLFKIKRMRGCPGHVSRMPGRAGVLSGTLSK